MESRNRFVTIVAIAATCSSDFATGFYHDYSGYVVFLVAVFLMVVTGGMKYEYDSAM